MRAPSALHAPLLVLLTACGSSETSTPVKPPTVLAPELGKGDHTAASLELTPIVTSKSGLKTPRDLAFNPVRPDELWIVNFGDDSMVIVKDTSTDERTAERRKDDHANHFMAKPASLAFGDDRTSFGKIGTFATCGESRNTYDDQTEHNDFMGPALWPSDLDTFAKIKSPDLLGSHLDMLHNSPLCMGIAHVTANRYWTFGGFNNSIDLYDFQKDHNVGQDDHSDGKSYRYVKGQVKYVEGVPSHLVYDDTDAMLYIADTGNGRIAKLDTTTGKAGAQISPKEPMDVSVTMDGATLVDVVAKDTGLLEKPSGLEMKDGLLYVSDNANGRISAFNLAGERVNYLDTGLPAGALAGMAFGPDGKLYFVDMIGNRVFRVDVP